MSTTGAHYFPGILTKAPQSDSAECGGIDASAHGAKQQVPPSTTAIEEPESSRFVSDEALLARICDGDKEALALLFRRYARLVRSVAFRVLRDASESEDLLQDLFLSIYRKCTTYDSSKSPARFWILQMTYRRAISRRRYLDCRHFYKQVDIEDEARELLDPRTQTGRYEESVDGVLGNGRLKRMFAELSENQRQTLRLYFFEGYTFEEIAAKLNQTPGNIKHHYFRGLDKLRRQIFENGSRCKSAV